MTDLLPVTQADRDAVQAFHRTMAARLMSDIASDRPKLGEDEGDAGTLVQAFARHRLTHSSEEGRLREALPGIDAMIANIERWRETGEAASPAESKALYEGLIAARTALSGSTLMEGMDHE